MVCTVCSHIRCAVLCLEGEEQVWWSHLHQFYQVYRSKGQGHVGPSHPMSQNKPQIRPVRNPCPPVCHVSHTGYLQCVTSLIQAISSVSRPSYRVSPVYPYVPGPSWRLFPVSPSLPYKVPRAVYQKLCRGATVVVYSTLRGGLPHTGLL